MRRRTRRAAAAIVALAGLIGTASRADAQTSPIHARAVLRPGVTELGARVTYRGEASHPGAARIRWLPPESSPAFTWGALRSGYTLPRPPRDRVGAETRGPRVPLGAPATAWVEIPFQAFALGEVAIPGLRFEIVEDARVGPVTRRLPMTRLIVVAVMTPADSQARLRSMHGPLAAPWWERVPWRWVVLGLLLLAVGVGLVVWLRSRRRGVVATAPATTLDPAAAALAALAGLRRLDLPGHGRFAEHAFLLGQILRRYLEATVVTARPGDTTPELVAHLRDAELDASDLQRLAGLLRAWDRIKFARDPFTVEEAGRTEVVVEVFVRRPSPPTAEQVA